MLDLQTKGSPSFPLHPKIDMPENRFYHPHLNHKPLILQAEEMKHLLVMRPKINEQIELVDGLGHLATARVSQIKKQQIELTLESLEVFQEPSFSIIVAQGIPRLSRLDTLIEKGTELGMTDLWLFPGEQSEKSEISPMQEKRIHHLMVSSLKQCGRLFLPRYSLKQPIIKWQKFDLPLLFGDLRKETPPLKDVLKDFSSEKGVIFVVGPEKGLSEEEIHHLEALGGIGVSLHANILRTDTAPIAALSIITHLLQPPL